MSLSRRELLSNVVAGLASVPANSLLADRSAPAETSLFSLTGTAREVGSRFGSINRDDVRKHVADVMAGWRKRGLSNEQAVLRSKPFRRFAERFGPHWLEEADACAAAAETPVDHYIAYLAGKYRSLFFTEDCTSFAAAGDATADGAAIFHKNRDNARRAQSTYHKRITDAAGAAGFFAVGDTSDMGLMMMVNDRGLAGSADMGGLPETRPRGDGVMNPYILRLIAERAESCQQALDIIQQTITDGWYAGGKTSGTHWLFADKFGTILRVAQNSVQEKHWFHRDRSVFLAREGTESSRILKAAHGRLTVRHFHEAARSRDLCFGSSISALTVRIDPTSAIAGATVWTALPAWSPFLPLFPIAGGVPLAIADGTCFDIGYRLLKFNGGPQRAAKNLDFAEKFRVSRREFQDRLYTEAAQVQKQFRRLPNNAPDPRLAKLASGTSLEAWQQYRSWNQQVLSEEAS